MSHKKIEWTQVNRRNDNNWPDQRFNWGSMSTFINIIYERLW